MLAGRSWSGNERNNCFVNLGGGQFADISFVSGLDFVDDGRAVAVTDQDGDGDLDLWLRNRSGPQLRLMRNDHPGEGHFLSLQLEGTRSNRDAVGARVEVRSGAQRFVRWVAAGEGYLAQSSRRLHFGLGPATTVDGLTVYWPRGGEQRFTGLAVDRAYRIIEGSPEPQPLAPRGVRLADGPAEPAPASGATRVLLRVALPLPPTLVRLIAPPAGEAPRATLLNLWAHWCEPCAAELTALAEGYAAIHGAGVRVLAVSLDAPADRERAAAWFAERVAPRMPPGTAFTSVHAAPEPREAIAAVLAHVLGRSEQQALPASLLIDERGLLQMVALGPLEPALLIADARRFALDADLEASRRSLSWGRWYFRMPRDYGGLAADLKQRGLVEDARYYVALEAAAAAGR
jgi:hypothetical protein